MPLPPSGPAKPGPFHSSSSSSAAGTLPTPELAPVDEQLTDLAIWAVIFAGGIGSRFWPLSTPSRPKPLLALVTGRTLLEDTVGRLQPMIPPERVLVVTSHDIAPAIRTAIRDVPDANVLVEPRPLGTAAALAWAAQEISRRAGPNTAFVALHCDLAIGFPGVFREMIHRAAAVAHRERAIVSIAVSPTRADPHFGYVLPGLLLDADAPLDRGGSAMVVSFEEKPDSERAAALIARGARWHSGAFVADAQTVLTKLARYTPEIASGLDQLAAGDIDAWVARLGPTVSIERGLLERAERLLVVSGDVAWDDIGTWASLRRARELDDDGNGALGGVSFVDSENNIVHAEGGTVVLYGVERLLVVTLPGLTFVTTLDRANDLKPLLDALPGSLRISPGGLSPRAP
jgi:mannose-1-phosphate guanylyltransferase